MVSNTDYRRAFKIDIPIKDLIKCTRKYFGQRTLYAGPFGPPEVTEKDHKVDLHQVKILNWNAEGLEGVMTHLSRDIFYRGI